MVLRSMLTTACIPDECPSLRKAWSTYVRTVEQINCRTATSISARVTAGPVPIPLIHGKGHANDVKMAAFTDVANSSSKIDRMGSCEATTLQVFMSNKFLGKVIVA